MRDLAERVLRTIRKQEFLRAGDRVAVAVSGGADSVALLLLLNELRAELGIVLSVAHVNHKLRAAESDGDAQFVTDLAARLGLELHTVAAPIPFSKTGDGAEVRSGIEAAARELRYQFFLDLARAGRASKIATAHTLEDQAETVLLRVFRGTGIHGLAGIHPRLLLERREGTGGTAEVVRPLLGFRRAELREFLRERGQEWREDSSNSDETFLRNRVRHRLLPFIEKDFGAAAIEHMAELAEIARAEEDAALSFQSALPDQDQPATLAVEPLLELSLAAARRRVRSWIEERAPEVGVSFRLIEEILDLARGPAGKTLELRGAGDAAASSRNVRRGRDELVMETAAGEASDYKYTLPAPGEIMVLELGLRLEARLVMVEEVPEPYRDGLLNPELFGGEIVIRNWRAGDRYWPAHTSSEKKVKELLSDRHATGSARKLWPVAVANGELVWLRGFAAPEAWRARSERAIWIREKAGLM
jgi:tRNA(Ile)-lysidine synthase